MYQGTVWGPPLWNTHFADAARPLNALGFDETMFADDLSAYRAYAPSVTSRIILDDLQECQSELHAWGASRQILFDSGKESFHILARGEPQGEPFKFLGVTFDTKLIMDNACSEIAAQGHHRACTVLRLRPYYGTEQVISFYRSQVLSYIEVYTTAIHHANDFFLNMVDRVQTAFLDEMCLTEEEALLNFHMAPLGARRDIAILGILHRSAIEEGPPALRQFPGGMGGCLRPALHAVAAVHDGPTRPAAA